MKADFPQYPTLVKKNQQGKTIKVTDTGSTITKTVTYSPPLTHEVKFPPVNTEPKLPPVATDPISSYPTGSNTNTTTTVIQDQPRPTSDNSTSPTLTPIQSAGSQQSSGSGSSSSSPEIFVNPINNSLYDVMTDYVGDKPPINAEQTTQAAGFLIKENLNKYIIPIGIAGLMLWAVFGKGRKSTR